MDMQNGRERRSGAGLHQRDLHHCIGDEPDEHDDNEPGRHEHVNPAIDRWIYVFMAAWFIVVVLVGFIPDAMMKVALVKAGARPPFPPILHVHAALMGSFLLLLLAQTWLMATGRKALHMQLGVVGMVLAAALV